MRDLESYDPGQDVAGKGLRELEPYDPEKEESAQQAASTAEPKTSAAEAGIRGAANSATFGLFPRASAALAATVPALDPEAAKGGTWGARYANAKGEYAGRNKEAAEEHPIASGVGNVVGAIAGAEAAPVKAVLGKVGKLATFGAEGLVPRLASSVAQGATIGGAMGAGESKADDASGVLSDAAHGAAVGGVTGGIAHGLGEAGGFLWNKLKGLAEGLQTKGAVKAAGAIQKDLRLLRRQAGGPTNAADRLETIANDLHDEGLIKPSATTGSILEGSEAARQKYGQQIGDIYKHVDDQTKYIPIKLAPSLRPNVSAIGQAGDSLVNQIRSVPWSSNQATADRIAQELDNITTAAKGRATVPFQKLHEWRAALDDDIYGLKGTKVPNEQKLGGALGDLRDIITNELESKVDAAGKFIGNPDELAQLKNANQKYGSMAQVAKWAASGEDRAKGNNAFGLTSFISGTTGSGLGAALGNAVAGAPGVAVGSTIGMAAGMGARKLAAEHGDALSAFLARRLAGGAPALESLAARAAPAAQRSSVQFGAPVLGDLGLSTSAAGDKSPSGAAAPAQPGGPTSPNATPPENGPQGKNEGVHVDPTDHITKTLEQNPQALGAYATPLAVRLKVGGPKAVDQYHFIQNQKDPAYRKMVEDLIEARTGGTDHKSTLLASASEPTSAFQRVKNLLKGAPHPEDPEAARAGAEGIAKHLPSVVMPHDALEEERRRRAQMDQLSREAQ